MGVPRNPDRWVTLVLAVTLASALPAGADLAEVKQRGTLRVLAGHDENWFSLEKTGPPGFEREVLEGFARLHGLRFEAVAVERWEQAIPMLVASRGDLLAGVNDTKERRRLIDFTRELLPARSVVVSLRPAPVVTSLKQLHSARVAVVPDSIQQRRRNPDIQLGLSLGAAQSSAWGVRKSDPELRRALDAYLTEFRRHPGWSRLLVKYFGDDALLVLGQKPVN